jgi:DNA-binding transcriptional regulator YiaG
MLPMAHIRQNVFGLSQTAFAEIAGVKQPTVSRWEAGEFEPNRDELERIRAAAIESGKDWNDAWFFETPERVAS